MGTRKDLRRLQQMAFGGALVIKSTDVIGHADSPVGLSGDIGGFAGIGIAGAVGNAAFDMAWRKRKIRRARYHKRK